MLRQESRPHNGHVDPKRRTLQTFFKGVRADRGIGTMTDSHTTPGADRAERKNFLWRQGQSLVIRSGVSVFPDAHYHLLDIPVALRHTARQSACADFQPRLRKVAQLPSGTLLLTSHSRVLREPEPEPLPGG